MLHKQKLSGTICYQKFSSNKHSSTKLTAQQSLNLKTKSLKTAKCHLKVQRTSEKKLNHLLEKNLSNQKC